jgi:hypothetical protein
VLLLCGRYHGLKEEREEKAHEAEVVRVRLEQSSHHRQMEHLRQLKENISELFSVAHWHTAFVS